MIYTIDKLIETRPGSSIPENLQKKVDVILLNKKSLDWQIFGSSMYRIQKYYGDIDVREHFFSNKSIEDIIIKTSKSLQNMVTEINNKRLAFFSEIKAGLDTRYSIDIGKINNGIYYPNKDLLIITREYYRKKLFSKEEYQTIINNLKGNLTSDNYDIIFNVIRERRILRWTSNEILKGSKILPLNIKMTLIEALQMKTHVKIDYITVINGNFIEVTNIMFLGHKNKDGSLQLINTFSDYLESYVYVRQMRDDIEKLFFSDFYFNPFKASKRLYALFRAFYIYSINFKNINKEKIYEEYIEKIVSLIKGDVSNLYQIKSFLDSIKRLYKLNVKIPEAELLNQMGLIQFNLTNILFIPLEQINNINDIISLFKKTKNDNKRAQIINILIKNFINWINGKTIAYLNKVGLNPFPIQAYPYEKHYNHRSISINIHNKDFIALLFVKITDNMSIIYDNNKNILLEINNVPDIIQKSRTDVILPGKNFDDWINDNYEEPTINDLIINSIKNNNISKNQLYFDKTNNIFENEKMNNTINNDYDVLENLLNIFIEPDKKIIEENKKVIKEKEKVIKENEKIKKENKKVKKELIIKNNKKLSEKDKIIEKIKKNCEAKKYSNIYEELLSIK